jgi:murein DD-endopeptidase MepM/ murein hydrolase activator NlpD
VLTVTSPLAVIPISVLMWMMSVVGLGGGLSDYEILDPYRPPQCTWCPGNRGIEFDTPVGLEVRAVRSGYVSFVGQVAGTGYVVVDIGEGLRVTYGGILPGNLRRGDPVSAGSVIGIAQGAVHLGVRRGDIYVDPAVLWERRTVRARLIPG